MGFLGAFAGPFRFEGDTLRNRRNHATNLVLPKPKREFSKRSFKYNKAIHMHWNSLPNEAKNANSMLVHLVREICNELKLT